MKKKAKLFTTIASLCLAVALMAFGVYAATSVTITISGKVSYTAEAHVKAKVDFSSTVSNIKTGIEAESNVNLYNVGADDDASAGPATGSKALGDALVFTATKTNENMVYKYTITIKNQAGEFDENQYLKVELNKDDIVAGNLNEAGYTTVVDGELADGGVLARNETKSYTVTLTINPTRSVSNVNIGTIVTLSMQITQQG